MSVALESLSLLADGQQPDPYIPYPVRVESGMIDNPGSIAETLDEPAGVLLANGFLPGASTFGLVSTGQEFVAFDHVAVEGDRKKLLLRPTSKSRVAPDGHIQEEGVVVIHQPSGVFSLAAIAVDTTRRPWLAENLRGDRPRYTDDAVRVFSARTLLLHPFEIIDIDTFNFVVTGKAIA